MSEHEILVSILSIVVTIFIGYVTFRINRYLTKREKEEHLREAKQRMHYIKLEALVYSFGEILAMKFGDTSKKEFLDTYNKKRDSLIMEESQLSQILNQL